MIQYGYKTMGYKVKVQKVERPTNKTYYINLPVVLAEAFNIEKGEMLYWTVEDKNTLLLSRHSKVKRKPSK